MLEYFKIWYAYHLAELSLVAAILASIAIVWMICTIAVKIEVFFVTRKRKK